MIIIRSPLRISIGGGGTDIPSYYEKKVVFLYLLQLTNMFLLLLQNHLKKVYILNIHKLKKQKRKNIKHKIIKEVLKNEIKKNKIEITTLTDIPQKQD